MDWGFIGVVVTDYFGLLKEFAVDCPNTFATMELGTIIQTTLGCTAIENPEALSAVLGFLSTFLSMISPSVEVSFRPTPENAAAAREGVKEYGYMIMSCLLNGLLVNFPRDRDVVRDVGRLIYELMDCLDGGMEVFGRCVGELGLSSDEEKRVLCEGVGHAVGMGDGGKDLKRVLNGFSNGYRRRVLAQE